MSNTLKTTLLLGLLTGLIIVAGRVIGGPQGMLVAFAFALIMNFGSYWFSDKIVLRLYRAVPVSESQAPNLHAIVNRLSQAAGIPKPKIFMLPTDAANAFATGRDPAHAALAVTRGLVKMLDQEELSGVISHELAHIKNRDILIGSVAATLAGAIMILASLARWGMIFTGYGGGRDDDDRGGLLGYLAMIILAPMAAMLIQMAISRSREYQADATGAKTAGSPYGLARALKKIQDSSSRSGFRAQPQTSHLFIVNPLSGKSLARLFMTHPPVESRIERLIGKNAVI